VSKLPQIRRLVLEDFMEQKSWIARLFLPLNTFMESVVTALNKNLTITENFNGEVKVVTLTSVPTAANPLKVAYNLKAAPVSIHIGQVSRFDGAAFALTVAPAIQWIWTSSGLEITNLLGIVPTSAVRYDLTLVILTG
jgi:hypothetical protein